MSSEGPRELLTGWRVEAFDRGRRLAYTVLDYVGEVRGWDFTISGFDDGSTSLQLTGWSTVPAGSSYADVDAARVRTQDAVSARARALQAHLDLM